jgi:Protein of unknown function (DUF2958)
MNNSKRPNPLAPTESLDRHIRQTGITTGPTKLALIQRALRLRGTPPFRSQEQLDDPTVFLKIFDPCGGFTWLITEWDGKNCAFGMGISYMEEFGYIDLPELSEAAGPLGIGMEIDVWFLPQPLSQAIKQLRPSP